LFDTVDTVKDTLRICAEMMRTIEVDAGRMRGAIRDYVLATDVADYLVRKGLPFRAAHGISAAISRNAWDAGRSLSDLTVDEYRRYSPLFDSDILELSMERSVAARDVPGGTAPMRVAAALAAARTLLDAEGLREKSTD